MEGLRVALYAREAQRREPDPEPFVYRVEKWERLAKALSSEADAIAVAFPEVLGDTYTEMLVNLGHIARSKKMLIIKDPSPYLKEIEHR